jgi:glycyl-tRNA synthetase beta subunit
MELSLLALQAVNIALYAIDKVSGGALEKAGADVLNFLVERFQGKLQIEKSEPKLLEAAILSESERDKKFREELERLVTYYKEVQDTSRVSQNTESGVNINVDKNSGTVVGQQVEQKFFR